MFFMFLMIVLVLARFEYFVRPSFKKRRLCLTLIPVPVSPSPLRHALDSYKRLGQEDSTRIVQQTFCEKRTLSA
jgi:hypothetical protein